MIKAFSSFLGALCLLQASLTLSPGADWPEWRGPQRDGVLRDTTFPNSLDPGHFQAQWKVDLQESYSGPIIKGDWIFTTETADDEFEVVRAYDLQSGELRWKTQWQGAMRVPFFARSNGSWIRSTPAIDGDHLYVAGMRDRLVCLNATNGETKWSVDFMKAFGTELPSFGFVCSPLVTSDAVIVQAGASTVALKKSDGTVLWRSLKDSGGMNGSAFSSPIEHQFGDSRQILVQTRTELCGLDASNGRPLWSQEIPAFRGMNILTPTVHKDLVFTSSYGGKALGLKVTPSDDGWGVSQEWELKMQAYMSTPVIIDGHAYLHLRNQHFACVNLSTGESAWETKEKFGKYWSMIAAGNRILALDEKGELLLINASPSSFDVISRRKLGVKECWAHLAIAGDLVAIRSLKALEIFRWKAPEITQR